MRRPLVHCCLLLSGLTTGAAGVSAQILIHGSGPDGGVQLVGNDAAWLDTASDNKRDLPCTVTPVKPILGFDLRFHSGYDIAVPLRELAGDGDILTIVFRVTSTADKDSPRYFTHKYQVPQIDEDAKGDANLGGGFDIGEGDYHVDWLMHDRIERVCSSSWDITAALQPKDQGTKLPIAPHVIEASSSDFFKEEPPVTRAKPEESLGVKILVNYAPQQGYAAAMQPLDTVALMSILRHIQREPRVRRFSLVAFNMNEQRVVYRKEDADRIDFPALGKALSSLKFGMVDVKKLNDKHSGSDFLTNLVMTELANNKADAVIFAGPKIAFDDNVPPDNLRDLASVPYPVFYMNYNQAPVQNPWRDPVGNIVKHLKGNEYTITRPRDLWVSWSDIMSRISKMKLVAGAATSSQ